MNPPVIPQHDFDHERSKLRRAMRRATIATVLVLLVAVVLAITAALAATRVKKEQTAATENLWSALAAEAGSDHSSGKKTTLDAVASAVAIRPSPELRDRAISALAETEIRQIREVSIPGRNILHAAFSNDHRWVFIGTPEGICEQIDLETGETHRVFSESKIFRGRGGTYRLFLSPRNRFLAARYRDGSLVVWDVETGKKIHRDRRRPIRSTYRSVDFHPTKEHLIVYTNYETGVVTIHDLEARKTVRNIQADPQIHSVSVSKDDARIALATGQKLAILSFTGESLTTFETPTPIVNVLWHPDGKRITAGCEDACVHIFNLDHDGSPQVIEAQRKWLHRMNFSPSGDLLMTTGWDNRCRFFDFESGALVTELRGIFPHDFHHSGNQIAAFSTSKVTLFEIDRSEVYRPLGTTRAEGQTNNAIAISPDSRLLAGGNESSINIWNAQTGALLFREESGSHVGAAFSQDGHWFFTVKEDGNFEKRRIDLQDNHLKTEKVTFAKNVNIGVPGVSTNTPDGRFLSLPGSNGGWLVDLSKEPKISLAKSRIQSLGISCFVMSPDQRLVAYSSWHELDSKVWDHETGKLLANLPGESGSLQFSPDSGTLAAVEKENVTFWNTSDWSLIHKIPRAPDAAGYLIGIDWSSDGSFLAIGGEDGAIRLLNGRGNHEVLATLKNPHGDQIKRIRINPDGTRILAGGISGLCHFWDLARLEMELHERGLHWSHDGRPVPLKQAKVSQVTWLSGAGAIAAVIFGLLTTNYHRSLSRRFECVEALARNKVIELSEAEQQLMQSQKMEALGNLSAGIAHDFRNLLSVIRMSSDLIAEDCGERREILEETEQIQKAVQQGDDVVRSMLGFSKGGETRDAVEVPAVVEDLITMLGQQFLSGISLELDFPIESSFVVIPRSALEQALLNLVVNASDAMDGHGQLRIRCHPSANLKNTVEILKPAPHEKGHLALSVTDSGKGVSPENTKRIFEPFFSTKEKGARGGTGLGLSMVYRIAENWGFGISLDPGQSNPNHGTTFILLLPVADPPAHQSHSFSSEKIS